MRKTGIILFYLVFTILVKAQKPFTSIVPQSAVVAGEAFQVQYVVEDGSKASNFNAPVFQGFRVVSGPNVYSGTTTNGNTLRQSKNFVITLVALKPGRFIIPGAVIKIDGKQVKSNSSFIEVLSNEVALKRFDKETMGNSDYFLRPGENVQDKIRKNLFLKVLVDKRSCFVGEPVLATFKLYSRLESKSDIIKNPGFYGFTVYDMVNLADNQVATERVNGKPFDVHIIRKVQLYPLQAGVFTIDAIEVKNKVEFSRSAVNKKTEQEIVEGVLGNNEWDEKKENTEEFESSMSTEPVTINVKPVPLRSKPPDYEGAIGRFSITAAVYKKEVPANEENFLEITISGKGNFIQIPALSLSWPAGIEPFEPLIKDQLDKSGSPLSGSRTFRYPFVCSTPGKHKLQPVNISFFDTDSNTYKTVSSGSIDLIVNKEEKTVPAKQKKNEAERSNYKELKKIAAVLVLLLFAAFFYWKWNRRKPLPAKASQPLNPITVDEILQPATKFITGPDKNLYTIVYGLVWDYFTIRFRTQGSSANKRNLAALMLEKGIINELVEKTQLLLQELETEMYADVLSANDKGKVIEDAKELLKKIDSYFFQQT
jgi:BatD DUF11 like domain